VRALAERAEAAEKSLADAELAIEQLQDRVDDLESGIAVAETAGKASVDEVREQARSLQQQAADAKAAAMKGGEMIVQLRQRSPSSRADHESETALAGARQQLAELTDAAQQRHSESDIEREQLEAALAQAGDAQRKIDALTARAEAADLAIGRAGALQRQLDEALTRLAWLEREQSGKSARANSENEGIVAERINSAETRAREARAAPATRTRGSATPIAGSPPHASRSRR